MLAYSPMGRGILTGAFKPEELPADDFRTRVPDTYYSKENLEVVGSPRKSCTGSLMSFTHIGTLCSIYLRHHDPIMMTNDQIR